jgi:hypothetical protein
MEVGPKTASAEWEGGWGTAENRVRTGQIPDRLGRPEWDLLLHSSIVCAGRGILCKPPWRDRLRRSRFVLSHPSAKNAEGWGTHS